MNRIAKTMNGVLFLAIVAVMTLGICIPNANAKLSDTKTDTPDGTFNIFVSDSGQLAAQVLFGTDGIPVAGSQKLIAPNSGVANSFAKDPNLAGMFEQATNNAMKVAPLQPTSDGKEQKWVDFKSSLDNPGKSQKTFGVPGIIEAIENILGL